MKRTTHVARGLFITLACAAACLFSAGNARAHCDTVAGPVVTDAKLALQKGEVTPVLKWVKKEHEADVRSAFAQTTAVRGLGPEARALADRYFFETVVRLHRAGEGEPYTGLKDGPVDPIVVMADSALAGGSSDELVTKINGHLAKVIVEHFNRVSQAKTSKDASIEAGRAFVEAYVSYTHYLEAVHTAIAAAGHQHAAKDAHGGQK